MDVCGGQSYCLKSAMALFFGLSVRIHYGNGEAQMHDTRYARLLLFVFGLSCRSHGQLVSKHGTRSSCIFTITAFSPLFMVLYTRNKKKGSIWIYMSSSCREQRQRVRAMFCGATAYARKQKPPALRINIPSTQGFWSSWRSSTNNTYTIREGDVT